MLYPTELPGLYGGGILTLRDTALPVVADRRPSARSTPDKAATANRRRGLVYLVFRRLDKFLKVIKNGPSPGNGRPAPESVFHGLNLELMHNVIYR